MLVTVWLAVSTKRWSRAAALSAERCPVASRTTEPARTAMATANATNATNATRLVFDFRRGGGPTGREDRTLAPAGASTTIAMGAAGTSADAGPAARDARRRWPPDVTGGSEEAIYA